MLQRIDIKLAEYWFGYDEYYVFYDDEHMTQEQAEKELEFMDLGMGYDPEKYPYYLILPTEKKPILSAIKEYLTQKRSLDIENNIETIYKISSEEEMLNLIENQKFNDLREYLKQVNSADFPTLFEELDKEKMILVYRILPKEKAAEVFPYPLHL